MRQLLAAQQLRQSVPESSSEQEVNEDVTGRIDNDQKVGGHHESHHGGIVDEQSGVDRLDDVDDQGGSVTDEEDEDDCERHDCLVLLTSLTDLQVLPLPASTAQCEDQQHVEDEEEEEGKEEEEDGIESTGVEIPVEEVQTYAGLQHRRIVDRCELEEPGKYTRHD